MLPIYVDLDDVLCDTARGLLNLLGREYGKHVAYDDLTSFDLTVSLGIRGAEFEQFFSLAHHPDELMGYGPIPGAVAALDSWSQKGLTIAIVTGRPEAAREASLEWLARHSVAYDRFYLVDKYGRGNPGSNGVLSMEALSAMDFSLAVEDAPEMALHLAGRMQTPVALMDRPWNRGLPVQAGITRVTSWEEISPGEQGWRRRDVRP